MFWTYHHEPSPDGAHLLRPREPRPRDPRRHLIYGHDRRAPARDRRQERHAASGTATVADATQNYSITMSPNVFKDKVIVGTAGGDMGIRGYIAAFDAKTGKEVWRFYTIPAPGEPGNDSWSGDSWKTGGAAVWNAAAYDPETNLAFWGTGNPAPDWDGSTRLGDNLYSNSVVALDVDTGELEVALPIHAARRARLRLDASARARRHRLARHAAQGDALGEPQRHHVRARSRHGQAPVRQAVRQPQLVGPASTRTGRLLRVPGMDIDKEPKLFQPARARRDQLGAAVVQPAHGPLLRLALGELRHHRDRRAVPAARRHQSPADGDGAGQPRAVLQRRRRSVRRHPRVRPEHARARSGSSRWPTSPGAAC